MKEETFNSIIEGLKGCNEITKKLIDKQSLLERLENLKEREGQIFTEGYVDIVYKDGIVEGIKLSIDMVRGTN